MVAQPPEQRFAAGPGGRPMPPTRKDPADVAQLAEYPVSLRRILALFHPYRWRIALVMVLIAATSVVGVATPFITQRLFDSAIPNHDVPLLLLLVGAMLGVAVLSAVFGVTQTWQSTIVGQQVMHGLRTKVFAHLQRLPLDFFTRTRGGEVQSRLTNDINAMQSVVTNTATSIATNVTTVIATALAMVALSWQLSLLSLVVLPPAIWFTRKVSSMRRRITNQAQQALADLQTQIEESLSVSGVQLSKTLGSGPQLAERFTASSHRLTELEVQSQLAGRWRMASLSVIFAAIPAAIYLIAGLPSTGTGISIGTLVAFTGLQAALFRPLMGVLSVAVQVTSSLALFSRIFEYLDLPVTIDDPDEPVELDPQQTAGAVRFDHVSFHYPDSETPALSGIDIDVPAGSRLAIVGATGSGKSTLTGLVSRLHDPTEGSVRIDGVDVRDLRLTNLAQLVGVVSQDTYLLHASIADNLRYARPDATDEELLAAAETAQLHGVIADLPHGYDTLVGSRGHRFSGGEKQRIALARTILRNPPVLVLDEATSALDNTTERAVQRALDELSHGRTTITIAHRLSTIRNADRIVVLDHGRIVEQGRHDDLLAAGGRYAELLRSQQDPVTAGH